MIETERLLIRSWRDSDLDAWAEMGADPLVMEHLGDLLTRSEVEAAMQRQRAFEAEHGHCFWALERKADGAFLGFCGIKHIPEAIPVAGEPEIGWRLARAHWGKGYAREAAEACLAWAWRTRDWAAVYAITTGGNVRSWGLMERLGMVRLPELDFEHPNVPPGHRLRPHITYVARRP